METTTIKLKKPIEIEKSDGTKDIISELVFRKEATIGDMESLPADREKHVVGDYLQLAAMLCGKPVAILKKMSTMDMEAILSCVGEAIAPGRATGVKG